MRTIIECFAINCNTKRYVLEILLDFNFVFTSKYKKKTLKIVCNLEHNKFSIILKYTKHINTVRSVTGYKDFPIDYAEFVCK